MKAGGRRQKAGGRRQEAEGRRFFITYYSNIISVLTSCGNSEIEQGKKVEKMLPFPPLLNSSISRKYSKNRSPLVERFLKFLPSIRH
ncbi:MAG: hypothetical protein F6K17_04115 [Okeania sp. SIO3C4]|nr:hypothetical protein [Okeania sp. SIO3C4]